MSVTDTILYGWPYVALVAGVYLLVHVVNEHNRTGDARRRSWSRDLHGLSCISLPLYMIHQFEEHGYDLLGRPYAFQQHLCGILGYRGDLNKCPASAEFIFAGASIQFCTQGK